jgi:hypothetical protein
LIALATTQDPDTRPLIAIANDRVAVTILKASADGGSMIVRLRSFSGHDEQVGLSWPSRTPHAVRICDRGEEPGPHDAARSVIVPRMGLVTLAVKW